MQQTINPVNGSATVEHPAAAWFDAGFTTLVPIAQGTKRPATAGWQHSTPSRADVAAWAPGTGIGLRHDGFVMIDVDVDDPALAAAILAATHRVLGTGPVRTGRAPRAAVLFRADKMVASAILTIDVGGTAHKVEIRASPMTQTVVSGRHPSGVAYSWDVDPVAIGAAKLRAVDEQDVERLLAEIGRIAIKAGGTYGFGSRNATGAVVPIDQTTLAASDPHVAALALAAIDNDDRPEHDRGYWIRIAHSFKAAVSHDDAFFTHFDAWSARHPSYDPAATRRTWNGIKASRTGASDLFLDAFVDGWQGHPSVGWGPIWTTIPAAASSAPDEWLDPAQLCAAPIPPRKWIIDGWLEEGKAVTFFGAGGGGKSLLAQQLASAVASGTDWIGEPVLRPGPVLAIFCEDDADELARRQDAIRNVLGIPFAALAGSVYQSRVGKSNVLARFGRDLEIKLTPLFRQIEERIAAMRPRLVIIDNIAQVFAGNENDRSCVTQFGNACASWGVRYGCAVVIVGHTAKAEGSEYSGSTAWDAAVRQRWFFGKPKEKHPVLDLRVLTRAKANNAATGTEIKVNYDRVFVPLFGGSSPAAQAHAYQQAVIGGLRELALAGSYAAPGCRSTYFAESVLPATSACSALGMSGQDVADAIKALLAAGVIAVAPVPRPNRKTADGYVETGTQLPPPATP